MSDKKLLFSANFLYFFSVSASCSQTVTALSPNRGCHDSLGAPSPPYAVGTADSALLHRSHFFILFTSPLPRIPAELLCAVLNMLNEDERLKGKSFECTPVKVTRNKQDIVVLLLCVSLTVTMCFLPL